MKLLATAAGCKVLRALALALLCGVVFAPQSSAQLAGYKGKRHLLRYTADLDVGFWVSNLSSNAEKGDSSFYIWPQEISYTYHTSPQAALELSVSYARRRVNVKPDPSSSWSFDPEKLAVPLTGALLSDYALIDKYDYAAYEAVNQFNISLAYQISLGRQRLPIGAYFAPSLHYSRFWTDAENIDALILRNRIPTETTDYQLSLSGYGVGAEFGFQGFVAENVMYRVGLSAGLMLTSYLFSSEYDNRYEGETTGGYLDNNYRVVDYKTALARGINNFAMLQDVGAVRFSIGYIF